MNNKKILMSLLLVFIIALSASAISAEDVDDVISVDDAADEIAVDEAVDVAAATDDDVISANTYKPDNNTADAIQKVISAASEGDVIDLSDIELYDVSNSTIEVGVAGITIQGSNTTVIQGWGGPGNGIFHVSASGVTFKGIIFVDTNPDSVLTYYDDATKNANEVKGWGIHFQRASEGLVDNCVFQDFNHGVRIQQQSNNVVVQNCVFSGVTNYLRNDPTVNVEKGTKAIGVMGSQNPMIINNTFNGPVLDAISLASGCGGAQVIGNTFFGNAYSIYFGGASTGGTLIKNNTFTACGYYSELDNNNTTVTWEQLPVISIQKSAAGLQIIDNIFEAVDNSILIGAEAGNTAHGYPSEIGNINVTGNTVSKYNETVCPDSVVLLHILSRGGELNPTGPIDVSSNTFEGAAKALVYWNTDWGSEYGNVSDIVIPKGTLAATVISITNIDKDGNVTAELKDVNGNPIAGEKVSYSIDGGNATEVETDENGQVIVAGEAGKEIVFDFAETSSLAASTASITIPEMGNTLINTTIDAESTFTRVANDFNAGERGEFFYATLKDAEGNPLANKTCYIAVNGPIYNATTDENGKFGIKVNFAAANTYTYALSFLGDDQYAASFNCTKLVMTAKKTTLSGKKVSYKASAKTKTVSVTLKTVKNQFDGKTYLSAGKKISFTVNGKTYTAKTDKNGVAKVKVSITKKGTYTVKAKFAGDNTYKASSTSLKLVLK